MSTFDVAIAFLIPHPQFYIPHIFKRRLVAFKGGFAGRSVRPLVRPSVCLSSKNFQKVLKKRFINQIDMRLDSTYE